MSTYYIFLYLIQEICTSSRVDLWFNISHQWGLSFDSLIHEKELVLESNNKLQCVYTIYY